MERRTLVWALPLFFLAAHIHAANDDGNNERNKDKNRNETPAHSQKSARPQRNNRASRPAPVRQPVMIHMNGSHDKGSYQPGKQPSYGQTQWNHDPRTRQNSPSKPAQRAQPVQQPAKQNAPGTRAAVAVHHHPYTQGYVRKRLSKIGVKTEPSYITDRSEIMSTDRAHSMIGNPSTGPKGEAFRGVMISPRKFNNDVVRRQMAIVNRPDYMRRIEQENSNETQRNHVYWHGEAGVNYTYAHYMDDSGYHWYGWYAGDQFFWTRNYNGRWWWYDTGFNRWCFYNNNNWWWQDPYHVGELYVYDNDDYIPANSADDPVVVTGQEQSDDVLYYSPDGTRTVKVVQGSGDAFLYDRSTTPSFDPIYLASGVQSIQFSDVNSGRSLEIILKLNDGSYDMFNGQGHPYNSENYDEN